MKLMGIVETEGSFEIVKPTDTADKYLAALRSAKAAQHQYLLASDQLRKFEPHVLNSYNGNWKEPVSHQAKFGYSHWAMPAKTPNGDELWRTVEHYGKRVARAYKLAGRYRRLATKFRQQYRGEMLDDLKSKNSAGDVPSSRVPRRIHYTKTNYFNNPYWIRDNVITRYAGHVGHFPNFTNAESNTLAELERTLRRYGIPGLKTLYGVTLKKGRQQINHFVVIGADGRFIWKRIGGNTCYVDGKKVSITYLTDANAPDTLDMQKQLLEPLTRDKT